MTVFCSNSNFISTVPQWKKEQIIVLFKMTVSKVELFRGQMVDDSLETFANTNYEMWRGKSWPVNSFVLALQVLLLASTLGHVNYHTPQNVFRVLDLDWLNCKIAKWRFTCSSVFHPSIGQHISSLLSPSFPKCQHKIFFQLSQKILFEDWKPKWD